MSRRLLPIALVAALTGLSAYAQELKIKTYTQSQTGEDLLPYGLPVPQPINSLTPVDGFRSYASIEARLQGLALSSSDLSAHDVGRTHAGRPVWAYVVSDEDGNDVEGRPEAAFFIRASTHAREWGTPEVSTGTIERLIDTAGDQSWTRYLLDNTRLVIIPVQNIDGVLQTQRYPTQGIVGQDPTVPATWPRDGRMRRKNMRGVDEVLTTFNDHLGGIDLNRNSPPFWATSNQSTSNPAGLTYHGTGVHSEPENQAMVEAAKLGPETRYRLGIDVHTFSRVFFSSNTGRERLNAIQSRLISNLISNHAEVAGKFYTDVPDPPNRGIGAAAEYFAYQWLVPAWTLELEPLNDAREYGGTAVTHGGFILPASQARRVRDGWAETHAVAFYMMAGPPHLARVRFFDAQTDELVSEQRWQYDPQTARRNLVSTVQRGLQPGARYRAELSFSKPMRRRDASGAIRVVTGLFIPNPAVALLRDGQRTPLSTSSGAWVNDPARVLRYRDDTFAFEFDAPNDLANYQIEVDARDMTNLSLDSDPSTPADWAQGAWSEYEDAAGNDGDVGGADATAQIAIETAGVLPVELIAGTQVVGEGDFAALTMRRASPGPERIVVVRRGRSDFPPTEVARWEPGEAGDKTVYISGSESIFPENLDPSGDREFVENWSVSSDSFSAGTLSYSYRILDNDSDDEGVYRLRGDRLGTGILSDLYRSTRPAHLVLESGSYEMEMDPTIEPALVVHSTLHISGNGASIDLVGTRSNLPGIDVGSDGRLSLDRLTLRDRDSEASHQQPLLRNAGELNVRRSTLRSTTDADITSLIENSGAFVMDRSLLNEVVAPYQLVRVLDGQVRVNATTVSGNRYLGFVGQLAGAVSLNALSIVNNQSVFTQIEVGSVEVAPQAGHALLQGNQAWVCMLQGPCAAPPPPQQNCRNETSSLGFNIENYTGCGFTQATDRNGLDLGDFEFDPQLGGYAPIGAAIDGGATAAQAAATGCGPVDQRGAPRPQTLTAGAEPRCDIGAIELGVNPYRGIWEPTRAGHGVDIQTAGNTLFIAWYTYGDDGQPTAYQAAAPLTGPHWEADLLQPRRDPQSGAISTPKVGRVSLDFASDTEATLGWRFDARGVQGSEALRPSLFAAGEPRFEVTGLWYPPQDSGYGATISRRGEITAIGLYYYDAQGNVRWALGTANAADAAEYQMFSYTGFCPDCDASQMPVSSSPAGTLLAHFHTPERARLDMQLTYPGAAGGQWNKQQARFVPLNDLVDNRYPLGTIQ